MREELTTITAQVLDAISPPQLAAYIFATAEEASAESGNSIGQCLAEEVLNIIEEYPGEDWKLSFTTHLFCELFRKQTKANKPPV